MKTKKSLLLFILILLSNIIHSQEVFHTSNGHLFVTARTQQFSYEGSNKKLIVILNNDQALIKWHTKQKIHLYKGRNETQEPPVMNDLEKMDFAGSLSIRYIKTESHPPIPFSVEGKLSIGNHEQQIRGRGLLTHIETAGYDCILEITFEDIILNTEHGQTSFSFKILQSILVD